MTSRSWRAIVFLLQTAALIGENCCDAFHLGTVPLVDPRNPVMGRYVLSELLTSPRRPRDIGPIDVDAEFEDLSFNATEWDQRIADLTRKREPQPTSEKQRVLSTAGLCLSGVQVPTVYLLGAQKAGTSTLAFDLVQAGVRSGIGVKKELHLFDDVCDQKGLYEGNRCDWLQNHDNYKEAMRGRCEKVTEQQMLDWRQNFTTPCESEGDAAGPVADMTPRNLRIPYLAPLLSKLYGAHQGKLSFIIMLRDPLKRLHSQYNYRSMKYVREDFESCGGFSGWVAMACDRLQALQSKKDSDISRDFLLDGLYRSMYSLNLRPWVQTFSPQQFTIILSTRYLTQIKARRDDIETFAGSLGALLNASAVQQLDALNVNKHPSLDEQLSRAVRERVQREVFDPDAKRLSELLAPLLQKGLRIAGYTGPDSPNEVLKFLKANW